MYESLLYMRYLGYGTIRGRGMCAWRENKGKMKEKKEACFMLGSEWSISTQGGKAGRICWMQWEESREHLEGKEPGMGKWLKRREWLTVLLLRPWFRSEEKISLRSDCAAILEFKTEPVKCGIREEGPAENIGKREIKDEIYDSSNIVANIDSEIYWALPMGTGGGLDIHQFIYSWANLE